MILLALTTSTDQNSLCLMKGTKALDYRKWSKGTKTSEEVTYWIFQSLKKAKLDAQAIEAIAIDIGPGSFTGCRISANVAKGLSYSTGCKLYPFTSLKIMAIPFEGKHQSILCHLDAHRSLFYYQEFNGNLEAQTDRPQTIGHENFRTLLRPETKVVGPDKNFPDAKILASWVGRQSHLIESPWQDLEPLYIRAPDAVERYSSRMGLL